MTVGIRRTFDDRSEARLYRKGPGKEAKLCFMEHALTENAMASLSMPV
jgi:hypothetical protein